MAKTNSTQRPTELPLLDPMMGGVESTFTPDCEMHTGSADALVATGIVDPAIVPGWPVGRGATKASWWRDAQGAHIVKTIRGGRLHYVTVYAQPIIRPVWIRRAA